MKGVVSRDELNASNPGFAELIENEVEDTVRHFLRLRDEAGILSAYRAVCRTVAGGDGMIVDPMTVDVEAAVEVWRGASTPTLNAFSKEQYASRFRRAIRIYRRTVGLA